MQESECRGSQNSRSCAHTHMHTDTHPTHPITHPPPKHRRPPPSARASTAARGPWPPPPPSRPAWARRRGPTNASQGRPLPRPLPQPTAPRPPPTPTPRRRPPRSRGGSRTSSRPRVLSRVRSSWAASPRDSGGPWATFWGASPALCCLLGSC